MSLREVFGLLCVLWPFGMIIGFLGWIDVWMTLAVLGAVAVVVVSIALGAHLLNGPPE